MDLAEVTLLASVAGCVVVTVLCLSANSSERLGCTRWPLVVALVITVMLGALIAAVLLVASRHGVLSVGMGARMPGTASGAQAWGLAGLSATIVAVAMLAGAIVARRPRLQVIGLATAVAALFVLALASGWWVDVEHWAG